MQLTGRLPNPPALLCSGVAPGSTGFCCKPMSPCSLLYRARDWSFLFGYQIGEAGMPTHCHGPRLKWRGWWEPCLPFCVQMRVVVAHTVKALNFASYRAFRVHFWFKECDSLTFLAAKLFRGAAGSVGKNNSQTSEESGRAGEVFRGMEDGGNRMELQPPLRSETLPCVDPPSMRIHDVSDRQWSRASNGSRRLAVSQYTPHVQCMVPGTCQVCAPSGLESIYTVGTD